MWNIIHSSCTHGIFKQKLALPKKYTEYRNSSPLSRGYPAPICVCKQLLGAPGERDGGLCPFYDQRFEHTLEEED